MGANSSAPILPFPREWLDEMATAEQVGIATSAVGAISSMDIEKFLAVRAPLPELEDTVWESAWEPGEVAPAGLADFKAHAAAAVQADPPLNRLVYKCVPRRVPEAEFWRCFFCWAHHAVTALDEEAGGLAVAGPPVLSKSLLEKGDDATSNAIIGAFRGDAEFDIFARAEMDGILQRDAEDDDKLAAGITMAVGKGVLPADPPLEPLTKVDVLGKSADVVAAEIIAALGSAPASGCVLVLQGLSGTGKGTTCAKLQQTLPRCTAWSNGNVFRAITLLAVTRCEQSGTPFGSDALTPALLQELVACLSFGKFGPGGAFDIAIKGYGLDMLVSQVANTVLKEPKVGKNIPTVAKMTQGEVIAFAANAADMMRGDGMNVLMEGRAQTLNYVRTPHRFELTLSDPIIIGYRRAAQRMMGAALEKLKGRDAGESVVKDALAAVLAELVSK